MRAFTLWPLALVLLVACRSDEGTALGTAERFVDQHYVRIDLAAALPYCTGLALQKVQEERRLTEGQSIDESTRRPTVHYRLLEKTEEADHATFVFQGTIRIEDADSFARKWLITTRLEGTSWRVSNFEEFD